MHGYFPRDALNTRSVEAQRLLPTPTATPPPAALPSHSSDKRDYTAEKSVPGLTDRSQAHKSFCIIWTGFSCLRAKDQLHLWWCE